MSGADLFVLIAYFATMSVVGLACSHQNCGVSYFQSNLSAFGIIVYAWMGDEYGLVAITIYCITTVPTTIVATLVFARRWRRTRVITPTEFLGKHFSPTIHRDIVWSHSLSRIAAEALKLVAIGLFAAAGMKLSLRSPYRYGWADCNALLN